MAELRTAVLFWQSSYWPGDKNSGGCVVLSNLWSTPSPNFCNLTVTFSTGDVNIHTLCSFYTFWRHSFRQAGAVAGTDKDVWCFLFFLCCLVALVEQILWLPLKQSQNCELCGGNTGAERVCCTTCSVAALLTSEPASFSAVFHLLPWFLT